LSRQQIATEVFHEQDERAVIDVLIPGGDLSTPEKA
jgi:hypothetical protein